MFPFPLSEAGRRSDRSGSAGLRFAEAGAAQVEDLLLEEAARIGECAVLARVGLEPRCGHPILSLLFPDWGLFVSIPGRGAVPDVLAL